MGLYFNFRPMIPFSDSVLALLKDKSDGFLQSLPLLPPASTRLENTSVLKQESKSAVALAELRVWLQQHHNPTIFINGMMLGESLCNSVIEKGPVPFEKPLETLAVQSIQPDFAVAEILRCREAYKYGLGVIQEHSAIELKHIFQIVALLQGIGYLDEKQVTLPDDQNKYMKHLQNLCTYLNDSTSDISPLIRMTVQHYQFEIIHPFYLENGRASRILNLLFLQQNKILNYPVLTLSEYLMMNKIEYYHHLEQVREQNEWSGWILFLLRGLEQTTRKTMTRLLEIQKHYEAISNQVQTQASSIYTKSLVDVIFERPYCKIEYLQEFNIAKRKAAGKYLHTLRELGILEMKKIGKENIFINRKMMDALHF